MHSNTRKGQLDYAISAARKFFEDDRIDRSTLRRPGRSAYECEVRFYISAWFRAHTDYSYPQIARLLHKKDHTTIMNGVKRAYAFWGNALIFQEDMRPKALATEGIYKNSLGWVDKDD